MSRDNYYDYIQYNNLLDILNEIPDLSYSKKLAILKQLNLNHNFEIINKALQTYKSNYIDGKRINITRIVQVLKGMCVYFEGKK